MRFLALFSFSLFITFSAAANDTTKLYNPWANAAKDIEKGVATAKATNKHVLVQVGGNWCTWCYKLNSFMHADTTIKTLVKDNFVVVHVNYSKENKNEAILKGWNFPQRFGFPVLLVLDKEGRLMHTQDSGLLEKGNGYDRDKIISFLRGWAPGAFDEAIYKD